MRLIISLIAWVALFQVSATAAAQGFALGVLQDQFEVERNLTEISGLAVASEASVYAHDDEHGIVYEVALDTGKAISAFALGTPTIAADFEGVAQFDGRIYLITSDGLLYEAPIGAHRERVRYNIYDTGVGEFCEVEGLTKGPDPSEFLIVCKTMHSDALKGRLFIFSWNLDDRVAVDGPWLELPHSEFLTMNERASFRPSAIEWREADSSFFVLSARNQLLVQLGADKSFVAKTRISADRHRQAEGLAVMNADTLVIADEGTLRLPGQIAIYGDQSD